MTEFVCLKEKRQWSEDEFLLCGVKGQNVLTKSRQDKDKDTTK